MRIHPPMDENFAHDCFSYLVEIGYLEPPTSTSER